MGRGARRRRPITRSFTRPVEAKKTRAEHSILLSNTWELLPDSHTEPFLVDHLREPCPKRCNKHAAMRLVRNSRCAFKELMTVIDVSSGAVHNIQLHTACTVAVDLQRKPPEAKWPS